MTTPGDIKPFMGKRYNKAKCKSDKEQAHEIKSVLRVKQRRDDWWEGVKYRNQRLQAKQSCEGPPPVSQTKLYEAVNETVEECALRIAKVEERNAKRAYKPKPRTEKSLALARARIESYTASMEAATSQEERAKYECWIALVNRDYFD